MAEYKDIKLVIDPADPRPWERQEKETERQYQAFLLYRDQEGQRSYTAVARQLRFSPSRASQLAERCRWDYRALAWDRERQRVKDAAQQAALDGMIDRHAKAGTVLYNMALRGMAPQPLVDQRGQALTDAKGDPLYRPPTLPELAGAAMTLDKAIRAERLAAGLPTDVTRQDVITKQEVRRVAGMMEAMMRILEEHLCDDCRDTILAQMRQLGRAAIAEQSAP